ncbi:MAG: ribosome silencing factor [Thermoleophilia bacterium]|nr:ribosome silencing factor [Thermoleophilia bacterium]
MSASTARSPRRKRRVHSGRPEGVNEALSSLEQARRVAALAQEKLATDVVILDMRPVCTYTDYFVVCTGRNPRQTKAIYDEVREQLKRDERIVPRSVAGEREARWIVADYLDLVLHIFTPDARAYYRLEELWGDVPAIEVEAAVS